jgi:hypothetical protein
MIIRLFSPHIPHADTTQQTSELSHISHNAHLTYTCNPSSHRVIAACPCFIIPTWVRFAMILASNFG